MENKGQSEVQETSEGSPPFSILTVTLRASSLLVLSAALFHVVCLDSTRSLNATIVQTYNLACYMRSNTTVLLNTYLSHQGVPFSNPGFSAQKLHYEGVPTVAIPFLEWRILSDGKRLGKNYEAYSALSEFLQLVLDDQLELNPNETELLDMLRRTQQLIQGLLNNLTAIMTAMGVPSTAPADPLMLDKTEANSFEKKVRGYVVCQIYKEWVDRTVRDFSLLMKKYPV
ncbi:cardiotrophin-2-like [Hemicordylus capensis]|uniref:cardiotrophin-2-like n=1 Tax=Hemicordylus capensis TaxID=884348 RepID=UPI0023038250|nr:cardiotrophin-2-like [Hemicordylus capensis]